MKHSLHKFWHPYRYIDKVYRDNDTPCGYCHCDAHRGWLNVKLMKSHKCITKQCQFFEKYEKHEYWQKQEKRKQLRKQKKQQTKI